jgi:glycosyltransferase involved in cell wall biosynthesis
MKRIAIVTSHPIQYNAPWFKLLTESNKVRPKVFYTWEQSAKGTKYDPDFGKAIEWDIPLLEGYEYTFVKNIAPDPGTHHFKGLINPTLNKEIAEWQPDAVLVFGWSFHSHLRCLRHFHKKLPVLFRGDSTLLDERPGIKKQLRSIFLRWVYRNVDYALYVGTNNKQYFEKYGLKEDQLVFAPHAIDNGRFAEPDTTYREAAANRRKELGIAETDGVLLFAGKLEPKKNPFFLLELSKKITELSKGIAGLSKSITGQQLKIVIVGNGILEAGLKEAAANDPRIIFMDFQNQLQMPIIYRIGDIFILPSKGPGETWGLGANEAMASGCAIMLSNKVGGAVDLVRENENGIVFGTTDIEQCAAWIGRLLNRREDLEAMKNASRRMIDTFSYQQSVEAIERIILGTPRD